MKSGFTDLAEEFEFDEPSVDYIDAPLSGWLRAKSSDQSFAFDCQIVVPGLVWHWTLVPVEERGDVTQALSDAAARSSGYWICAGPA
jgi:hypothetical protein